MAFMYSLSTVNPLSVLNLPPRQLFDVLFNLSDYQYQESRPVKKVELVRSQMKGLLKVFEIVLPYLKDSEDKPYVFSDSDSDSDSDCGGDGDGAKRRKMIQNKKLIFLATLYRGYKRQQWIDSWCVKDVNVQNWIESTIEKGRNLWVNTAAFCRGTGIFISVIIRDSQGRPIVCFTECVSSELLDPSDSIFDEELQSVNKGLELAIKYGIKYVDLHCVSEDAVYFIQSSQVASCECFCVDGSPETVYPPCKICFKLIDFFDGQGRDRVKVNTVMVEILKKMEVIRSLDDHAYCEINPIGLQKNNPAEWLARNASMLKGELKPYALIRYQEFLDILYEEASGENGMKVFVI